MKTLIKTITSVTSEGVGFGLTEQARLHGRLETKTWWVSWDTIGKALFKDQYSDAVSVKDLKAERGEPQNEE